MNVRLMIAVAVWVPFSLYTGMVALEHGVLGFVGLAMREAWAMQMLIDLFLALGLFAFFAMPDARARGITFWPWLVASALLGSVGALGYVVYREIVLRGQPRGIARETI